MDINDVQEAMHTWEEAHAALQIYFEANDVMHSPFWERWSALVQAETLARNQALTAVNSFRDAEGAQ